MAQSRETPFSPSSPHSSSGGADSFKGTPDTRVTAFSPDGDSTKSAGLLKGATRSASATPVRFHMSSYRSSLTTLGKDPFVTPGRGKGLSPTASTFKPFAATGSALQYPQSGTVSTALSTDLGLSRLLCVSHPASLTTSEVETWLMVRILAISTGMILSC